MFFDKVLKALWDLSSMAFIWSLAINIWPKTSIILGKKVNDLAQTACANNVLIKKMVYFFYNIQSLLLAYSLVIKN